MGRVLVHSPHLMRADEPYYGEGSVWLKTWEGVLEKLVDAHGEDTEVALYPCAAMQISDRNAGLA